MSGGKRGRIALYLSKLPTRQQINSACTDCTMIYGMEMVGVLTNQPVTQLSQLFLQFQQDTAYIQRYGSDWKRGSGGSSLMAAQAAANGVCAEHLWSRALTYGTQQWLNDVSDYDRLRLITGTQPDAVCYADAPNHRLIEYEQFYYEQQGRPEIEAALDAGYALTMNVLPNHQMAVLDSDDTSVYGFDSRSPSPTPYQIPWAQATRVDLIIKRVQFSGVIAPPRLNPFMPNNNAALLTAMRNVLATWTDQALGQLLLARINSLTSITPAAISELWALVNEGQYPATASMAEMVNALVLDAAPIIVPVPPTGGNVPLLNDIISVAQSALAAGSITQAQIDQIRVNASLLAPVVSQPPATGESPERTVVTTSGPAIMLGGHAWTFGMSGLPGGMAILLDGISAGGGSALLMTNVSGKLWVRNLFNDWFRWDGGWVKTGQVAP